MMSFYASAGLRFWVLLSNSVLKSWLTFVIWFNSTIPWRTVCDHNKSRYSGVPWTTCTLHGKDLTALIVFHHRIQCFKKNQLQGKSEVKFVD